MNQEYWPHCILATRRSLMEMAMASSALLFISTPVRAAEDALEQPARVFGKAAKSILPGLARAGSRLVAVGERGIIVTSDDSGKHWSQASVPVSVTLTAVYFVNAKNGWAVGHDGVILASSDGGNNWKKQFDGHQANALVLAEAVLIVRNATGTALEKASNALEDIKAGLKFGASRPMLGVWFKNESEGYVLGAYGQFFHTVNGGSSWESWSSRFPNPDGLHYNAISGTARGTLLVTGEGGMIYRSRDDGASWQVSETGYKGHLYGMLATDAGISGAEDLLAFGFGGHIFRSADIGKSWQEIKSPLNKSLTAGMQLPDGTLLLAAQDGSLLSSDDKGRSFRSIVQSKGMSIFGMARLDGSGQIALAGVGGVHILPAPVATKGTPP